MLQISLQHKKSADKAICQMDGAALNGKHIKVSQAWPRQGGRDGGRGVGHGGGEGHGGRGNQLSCSKYFQFLKYFHDIKEEAGIVEDVEEAVIVELL